MVLPGRYRSGGALAALTLGLGALPATGQTNLQQTNSLVWVLIAISAAGAIVTFAFLVYAVWKFRDPKVKGRRYG